MNPPVVIVTLDRGDYVGGWLVDDVAVLQASCVSLHCADPDQLERLGEACLEAARDLRAAQATKAA